MKQKVKLKGHLKSYLQTTLILGILLAMVNVGIYFLNIKAGICVSGFLLVYLITMTILLYKNKPVIMNEFINFATQYGQIQRTLLRDLELPHVLMDEEGRIIWTNAAFEQVVHKEKGYRKSITTIFSTVTNEKLGFEQDAEMELSYEGHEYIFRMKRISIDDVLDNIEVVENAKNENFLIAGYLFDETALKHALKECDDQSVVIGMIYIDNYDEALESVEDVRRSLLMALIDRKINKYIASIDGIVRKTEKDKYLVIMRKKALMTLKESRFELLEDVKTVNIGNEMAVTVSIGVGVDAPTYAQNAEFARTAIDLALGRGGDQAIVKSPDSIVYYGGKSQQIEKNTRVKARVKANALQEIITSKDKVLIMGHRLADADAFGAAVGISCIARALGRKPHIVINDITSSVKPLAELFRDRNVYEEDFIIGSTEALESADSSTVLVVVDVNKPSITECPDLIRSCKTVVVLDHHRQSSEVIENATLSYVEPYASSTCEMVAEVLQYIAGTVKVRSNEADCMYSGIMVDTNNFTAKTGVRTFEAAAFLRRYGADVTRVRKMFRDGALEYKAKAETIRNAEIYKNAYAMGICPAEGLESPTEIGAQAANELLGINGIKASFVMTEYNGKIYISARSIDEVNVQIIMERLGGGGHMNIAGAQLTDTTPERAVFVVKETLNQMLEEGAI
ncbi:MAG: DHH family phosphoesterase [Lachnospiraceae bacterium]|jgi:c-di-AMP phosphodiesterase-like protein|nr:DHH family phosphoesterase [Lachnospiraceae bacterium]HBV84868.1 DHH family phosphoesterase [Lachnospiraceae bacterium]